MTNLFHDEKLNDEYHNLLQVCCKIYAFLTQYFTQPQRES